MEMDAELGFFAEPCHSEHAKNKISKLTVPMTRLRSPGKCHFYGRAELKQSDHRPIMAVLDIDVLKLNSRKREDVFTEELAEIGPPDGNVILQVS